MTINLIEGCDENVFKMVNTPVISIQYRTMHFQLKLRFKYCCSDIYYEKIMNYVEEDKCFIDNMHCVLLLIPRVLLSNDLVCPSSYYLLH
jgi:hypothetical protein